MKFEAWLINQKHRDDWIGDVACDYLRTSCKSIQEVIECYRPHQDILDAIDAAISEFKATTRAIM